MAEVLGLRAGGHAHRAVGHDRRDQAEDVVVGIEQVAAAADAGPILGRQCLRRTELDAAGHQSVDVIDTDHDVAARDRRADLGLRTHPRDQAAVDAHARLAGRVADRAFARLDHPVRLLTTAVRLESPAKQLAVEVDEPLGIGCVDLEVDDEIGHRGRLRFVGRCPRVWPLAGWLVAPAIWREGGGSSARQRAAGISTSSIGRSSYGIGSAYRELAMVRASASVKSPVNTKWPFAVRSSMGKVARTVSSRTTATNSP